MAINRFLTPTRQKINPFVSDCRSVSPRLQCLKSLLGRQKCSEFSIFILSGERPSLRTNSQQRLGQTHGFAPWWQEDDLWCFFFSVFSPLDLPGGQRPNRPNRRRGGGRDELTEERKEVRGWANPQIWLHQQRRRGQEMNVNLAELKGTIRFWWMRELQGKQGDTWESGGNAVGFYLSAPQNVRILENTTFNNPEIKRETTWSVQKHRALLVTWPMSSDTGTRCWSSRPPGQQLHWSTISAQKLLRFLEALCAHSSVNKVKDEKVRNGPWSVETVMVTPAVLVLPGRFYSLSNICKLEFDPVWMI